MKKIPKSYISHVKFLTHINLRGIDWFFIFFWFGGGGGGVYCWKKMAIISCVTVIKEQSRFAKYKWVWLADNKN